MHPQALQEPDQAENWVLLSYSVRNCPDLTLQPWQSPNTSPSSCGWQIIPHASISLSHRQDVANLSLFYHYSYIRCSDGLHSPVPQVETFTARTCHATYLVANHPHSLRIPLARSKFYLNSFFPWTNAMYNRFPRGCFPDQYSFNS